MFHIKTNLNYTITKNYKLLNNSYFTYQFSYAISLKEIYFYATIFTSLIVVVTVYYSTIVNQLGEKSIRRVLLKKL